MLMTGYNLVRGRAVDGLREAVERRYGLRQPEKLSAIALLRHIERSQPLPHKVVEVTGFPALWRVCPDGEGLGRMLFDLFFRRMNWLQNQNPYLYFLVPDDVTFSYGQHLSLRLSPDLYANMTTVFGHMRQVSSEHYHHNFTVSQV
jgi:hypothetical protein